MKPTRADSTAAISGGGAQAASDSGPDATSSRAGEAHLSVRRPALDVPRFDAAE
jgi:hypothetical protein